MSWWISLEDLPPRIRAVRLSNHFDPETGKRTVRIESLPWPKIVYFSEELVHIAITSPWEYLRMGNEDDGYLRLIVAGDNAKATYRLTYDVAHNWYEGKLESGEAELAA